MCSSSKEVAGLTDTIVDECGGAGNWRSVASGGEIAQPIGADAPEITARFRDPAGNLVGLYQQPA